MDPITITLGITTAGFAITTMVAMVRGSKWAEQSEVWQANAKVNELYASNYKQSAIDANKAYNTSQSLLADTERNLFLATEGRERTRALMDQEVRDHSVTLELLAKSEQALAKHEARRAKDNAARKARHQRAKVVA